LASGFDGVTGGNFSVAQAVIADVTPPEQRAKNFGLLAAAFGLGFIIGPLIAESLQIPLLSVGSPLQHHSGLLRC
jgi:MFS family permease